MSKIQETGDKVLANVERVIVGKHQEVRLALVALLCRGHLLIEDVPGTGKTMLAKAIARSLGGSFRRIQFTPDLLPSDVSGLSIYNQKTQEFEFRPGPIFSQVVLADEINRATPKTQSALLECMEERQATIDGTTYPMPDPFLVIATQNPIEYEGTFALPEAQLDRFMLRLRLGYPQPIEEIVILDEQKRTHPLEDLEEVLTIEDLREMQAAVRETYVDSTVSDYIVRLVNGTRNHPDVYLGASPRGSIALYRAGQALAGLLGRDYVIPDDIKALAEPALAHRLIIKTSSSIHDVQAGQVVRELLESTAIDGIRPTGGGPTELRAGRGRDIDAPRAPEIERSQGEGPAQVIRRLELLIVATFLVVAAFSTGLPFLFYLLYLAILVIGGSYVLVRLGLTDLEAGYAVSQLHGHVGDRLRVTYTLRNASRLPKLWLEVHNPTTLPGGLPGPGDQPRQPAGALVADPGAARPARPLPHRAASHPDRRPVRLLRGIGDGRSGRVGRRLSEAGGDTALAAAGRPGRGLARLAGPDPPDDAARLDGPAVRPGRQHESDPLEEHRPPRRDPGQGVRPRADRRCVDHPRPPARDPGRPRRRVHDRGVHPRRGGHRRPGAPGEPGGRDDGQRRPDGVPAARPRRSPAPQDHAAPRGRRGRRQRAAGRDPDRDGRAGSGGG